MKKLVSYAFLLSLLLLAGISSPSDGVEEKVSIPTEQLLHRASLGLLVATTAYLFLFFGTNKIQN